MRDAADARVAPALFGMGFAVYILVGRWGFGRNIVEHGQGPTLLELRGWIVASLVVLVAFRALMMRRAGVPGISKSYAFVALFGYLLLSALWAPETALAAAKAYDVFLVALATLAWAICIRSHGVIVVEWFWGAIVVIGTLLSALALLQLVGGGADGRLAVLGGGPNVFARIMGLLAVACLVLWRKRGFGVVLLPGAAIAALLIVLTGSRGSLIAAVGAVLVFFTIEVRSFAKLGSAVALLGIVFWLVLTYTGVGQLALQRYDERVRVLLLEERYSSGRGDLYDSAVVLGATAPVFGRGLAAFPAFGLGVYPHNIFLEMFCEAGMLGVLLLAAMLLQMAVFVAARGRPDGGVVAGAVLILIASQFSGDFYDSRGLFAFAAAIALLAVPRGRARRPSRASEETTAGGALA